MAYSLERRSPTGIARERETRPNNAAPNRGDMAHRLRIGIARQSPLNRGDLERRSPTGIARERETRTNNAAPLNRGDMERRSPTGIARERETRTNNAAPYRREWRTPCSIRTALFAALRAAVPAPTGRTGQRSAFPCLRVACAQSGLRRPPACGGLCRPEVGVPLPARHGARGGIRRDASPGGSLRAPKVTGGRWPPFHTFPPITRAANRRFATIVFARSAVRHPRRIAGTWSAGLRPAIRVERFPDGALIWNTFRS